MAPIVVHTSKGPAVSTPRALTYKAPVVPQPMAATTPVVAQPSHPESSNIVISNVASRRSLLPPPTQSELFYFKRAGLSLAEPFLFSVLIG